jgi:hypothetical protein
VTTKEAIAWLTRIAKVHGDNVPVYFDCPHCAQSFTPGTATTVALHVRGVTEPREEPK